MIRILQLALTGLCAGLLLVIAAELFHAANQEEFASVEARGSAAAGAEALVPAVDMEAAIAEILERPLFSPSRRPSQALFAANLGETLEKAPSQLHRRLAGVMISTGTREALFAQTGQRPIGVKVGGEIDGWTILAIEPDRVVLSSEFGTQTLKPTKAPEAVRPPPQATSMNLGMGPPINSGIQAAEPPIATRPSAQSSQVGRQVKK